MTTTEHRDQPDVLQRQRAWIERYMRASKPVLAICGMIQVIVYSVTHAEHAAIGIAAIIGYSVLLIWASYAVRHNRMNQAIWGICAGLLIMSVLLAFTNPEALPILIQLPLMALLVALPFLQQRVLYMFLATVVLSIVAMVIGGLLQPPVVISPAVQLTILISAALCSSGLIAMLLQYQYWFSELLEQTQHTNTELAKAKTNLELQIGERTAELQERELRYRRLFEDSIDVIYLTTPDGQVLDINPAGLDLLGYQSREEFLALDVATQVYVDPEDRNLFKRLINEQGTVKNLESRRRHKDGRIMYVEESANAIRDQAGAIIAYQGYLRDITDRKHVEAQLQDSSAQLSRQFQELQRHTAEMLTLKRMGEQLLACHTEEEAYQVAIDALQQVFSTASGSVYYYRAETATMLRFQSWGEYEAFPHEISMDECWALRSPHTLRLKLNRPCQHCSAAALCESRFNCCLPIYAQDQLAGLVLIQCSAPGWSAEQAAAGQVLLEAAAHPIELAITNLRLRETLRDQALRDPLTGLYNRRYLEESLERELDRVARRNGQLGVIMLDLDYFKRINDSYGHAVGDVLLSNLGQLLLANTRAEDTVSRYGGEEFLIILPEFSLEAACQWAEQICAQARTLKLKHHLALHDHLTVSLGVALFPDHGATIQQLLYQADMALYQAKHRGRNQVAVAPTNPSHSST